MKTKISQDDAEKIAFQALTYIVRDPELIGQFLAESGLGPAELKTQLKEPPFLGGVLDFFLSRSNLLETFAAATQLTPQEIALARLHFPGAQPDSWVG